MGPTEVLVLRRRRDGGGPRRRWPRGSPAGAATGAPLALVGIRTRGVPIATRLAAQARPDARPAGAGRGPGHHALSRRPRRRQPLAGPARDRDPLRRRRRRDRPGRRRPVHRPDDPRGPELDLRPRPAGRVRLVVLVDRGHRELPDPRRRRRPGRSRPSGRRPSGSGSGRSTRSTRSSGSPRRPDSRAARPTDDRRRRPAAGLEPQAPARPGGPLARGDPRHPRHRRVVLRGLAAEPQEGPRAAGPGRLQPLLRELDADPDQLQPRGQAALGRRPGLLRQRLQPGQGGDVHRHRQEHRGDGGRRPGRPPPHARAPRTCSPSTSRPRSSTPATAPTSTRPRACSTS